MPLFAFFSHSNNQSHTLYCSNEFKLKNSNRRVKMSLFKVYVHLFLSNLERIFILGVKNGNTYPLMLFQECQQHCGFIFALNILFT